MSIIRADSIKNRAGDGAPDFPNGITVTGVVTATTLNQNITGLSTFNGNIDLNGDLDVDGHTNLDNVNVAGVTTFAGGISGTTGTFSGAVSGSTGTFTGNVSVGGTLTYEDVTNIDSIGIVTARLGLRVPDDVYSYYGTGNDLSIRHDASGGGHSYIFNTGAGVLKLGSNNQFLIGKTTNANYIEANPDGDVKLYFNNNQKLATSNTGVTVTGTVAATSYTGDGSNLTGIDATKIQTGNTKVETSASSISNVIGNAGIATITAQGLNVTGIVTATSMKVFSSGIDYEWQGGTAMAWWKSEDMVSNTSWPAAKGGTNANLVSHNTSGMTMNSTDSSFNGHKTMEQGGNNAGGLSTSNDDVGYWWNGSDAFTVIMAMRKEQHNGGTSYGDSFFVHNVNSRNSSANSSWSIGPYGDHTWGGQYGEMWGGIQNYFEGLEMRFSYPWRGLFMIRMSGGYDYGELSVNGGSGWQRLDMRHGGPSGLGSSWRALSIFTNSAASGGHTGTGRIAEWGYWKKRLGGNELDAVTKSWCNKFNL